jgi:hypothetical protein
MNRKYLTAFFWAVVANLVATALWEAWEHSRGKE